MLTGAMTLADRPGELARLASLMARHDANISRFHFNRSEDPHVAALAADIGAAETVGPLAQALREAGFLAPPPEPETETRVTDPAGLLTIKVSLEDQPGTLANFAALLAERRANVLYLTYDRDALPGVAETTLATDSAELVQALLQDLCAAEIHYHVAWRGEDGAVDRAIGLSEVETFLFKLRALLPPDKAQALDGLFRTSDEMREALLAFRREAGQDEASMAASETLTNILQLAAGSLSRTGAGFAMRLSGPVALTPRVSLYMLACPTGANAYLLRAEDQYLLVDTGYGLYWPDVREWLRAHGFAPERIRRAAITHPDADHAGWARPLQEEFGTTVLMHPDCAAVFAHENRAHGATTRLGPLNRAFTRLINRITDLRPPREIGAFPDRGNAPAERGGFPVLGVIRLADLDIETLESLGGHAAGQVMFYAPEAGALFPGDYLIDFASLSDRVKATMSIPRYLMTSTNSDSAVFGREMALLRELMARTNARLQRLGHGPARVFPGHGEFYAVDEAGWG